MIEYSNDSAVKTARAHGHIAFVANGCVQIECQTYTGSSWETYYLEVRNWDDLRSALGYGRGDGMTIVI